MNDYDLNAVSSFIEVAKCGGFRKAASALGLPSSTLSTRISRLEKELGVVLLDRTTRTVRLTEAGQTYLNAVSPALESLTHAAQLVTDSVRTPTGRLRASLPVEFGLEYGATIFAQYRERCPQVDVQFDLNNRRIDLLEEGFDVAIRAGVLKDSTMICQAVGPTQSLVTCAAASYVQRASPITDTKSLLQHPCYAMSLGNEDTQWQFRKNGRNVNITIEPAGKINSYVVLKNLVKAGLGIARIPAFMIETELKQGSILELLADFSPTGMAFHALYPESGRQSRKRQEFVSVVDTVLRKK